MAAVLETRATNGDAEAMLSLAKMHARALEAGPSSRASSDSLQEARTLAMRWLGAHVRALGLGAEAAKLAQKLGLFWTPRGYSVLPWRSKPFAALTFTETQRYLPALCAILNKPRWWDKLRDGEIVARWRAEGTRPHRPGYDDSDYFRDFVPTEEETTKKKKKTKKGKKDAKTSVAGESLNCELDPGVTADQIVYHDPAASPPMKDPELFKLSAAEFEFMLQELRYVAENELVRPSFATQSVSGNASDEASVVITPITSPGVYISDSAIPESMREDLVHSLEPLEQFARQAGRWHPGSDDKVLDLLHPSQSCAVSGRTTFSFTPNTVAGEYRYSWPAPPARTSLGILDDPPQSSGTTQWIPSDVLVQKDGTVSFESHINGLGASAHRSLVPILSAILSRAVPLLELSVGSLKQAEARGDIWQKKPASQRTRQRTVKKDVFDIAQDYTEWMGSLYLLKKYGRFPTADLIDHAHCYDDRECAIDAEPDFESVVGARVDPRYYPGARLQAEFTPPTGKEMTSVQGPPPAPRSLRDTRMQVYVKIAMIELTPEKPSYPGGKWHLEGLQNEAIAATIIYYYEAENITSSLLRFRHFFDAATMRSALFDYDSSRHHEAYYGFRNESPPLQSTGFLEARKGRLVSFPNFQQHRVEPFRLLDATKGGRRGILAIFVVHPDYHVPSTRWIPPQDLTLATEGVQAAIGARFAPEIVQMITKALGDGVMTREEADAYAREFMEERKGSEQSWEGIPKVNFTPHLSFCEH